MISEPFAEGNSAIHRTSPGLRVVLATAYSFSIALMSDLPALVLALVFSVALVCLAQLPAKALAKRLGAAGGLLLMVWILVPLTYAGNPLAMLGPLTISRAGVLLCLRITCKTLAILMAFTALVATMRTATLGHSLHGLGMPAKLVQLLLLAYRYIFVIEQEYQRLYRAAKIRNFKPGSNLHTYRTYAYLVGMLFVRASERAVRVHQAMRCRGFNGRFHALTTYPATAWNGVLVMGMGSANILLVALEFIS